MFWLHLISSPNRGCRTFRASNGPCNAGATDVSARRVSLPTQSPQCTIMPPAWPCAWQGRPFLRLRAASMARWGNCRPTSTRQRQTGSHSTPPICLRVEGTWGGSAAGGYRGRGGVWKWEANSQWKIISPWSRRTRQNGLFFLEKPMLSEIFWGGLRERGWFSGGSTTNKPKGVRGVGIARTRLPPFHSLGWCRCAAPALLQTHSAFSASSSERCNFK